MSQPAVQWLIQTTYTATCQRCYHVHTVSTNCKGVGDAIRELKGDGWTLEPDGPVCDECQTSGEEEERHERIAAQEAHL